MIVIEMVIITAVVVVIKISYGFRQWRLITGLDLHLSSRSWRRSYITATNNRQHRPGSSPNRAKLADFTMDSLGMVQRGHNSGLLLDWSCKRPSLRLAGPMSPIKVTQHASLDGARANRDDEPFFLRQTKRNETDGGGKREISGSDHHCHHHLRLIRRDLGDTILQDNAICSC